jgi:hypothetical protein
MGKLVIDKHSYIDLITNSSTELFVCNTNKSLDLVKVLLVKLLDLYNVSNNSEYEFDDVFMEPRMGTADDSEWTNMNTEGKVIIESAYDNSIPSELFDIVENAFDCYGYTHL